MGLKSSALRRIPLYAVLLANGLNRCYERIVSVALIWLLLEQEKSTSDLGALAVASLAALALSTFVGGFFVDRFGPRTIGPVGIFLGLVPILALATTLIHTNPPMLLVLGLVFWSVVPDGPIAATVDSALPRLSGSCGMEAVQGNALNDGAESAAGVLGPLLGGTLVGLLGVAPTLFIAATLPLIALALFERFLPPAAGVSTGRSDLFAGFRFLLAQPRLFLPLAAACLFLALMISAEYVLLPALLKDYGPGFLGAVAATTGIGAVIGAASRYLINCGLTLPESVLIGLLIVGIGFLTIGALPSQTTALLGSLFLGTGIGYTMPTITAEFQQLPPRSILARVVSSAFAIALAFSGLFAAAIGMLSEFTSPRLLMACTGCATLLLAGAFILCLEAGRSRGQGVREGDSSGANNSSSA